MRIFSTSFIAGFTLTSDDIVKVNIDSKNVSCLNIYLFATFVNKNIFDYC